MAAEDVAIEESIREGEIAGMNSAGFGNEFVPGASVNSAVAGA